jgi:hypothetical protein
MLTVLLASWLATASHAPTLSCSGPHVPPTDFDDRGMPITMEFAVASSPSTTPQAVVERTARDLLVQRLCRLADPKSCAPLAAAAKSWAFTREKDTVCAMAVLRSTDLESWRDQLAPDLHAELRSALAFLVPPTAEAPRGLLSFGKRKKRAAVVVVDRITDVGAPGGLRADWLLGRVRGVLGELDVEMREPPKGWDGVRPPRDVEFLLRGNLVERIDPKKQLPVLEVAFVAVDARGVEKSAHPFVVPAALAPAPPAPVQTPPPTAGLSLHVETRAGGNLCPGDFTQLHVTNETDDALYVRVVNLDQAGEALVIFPSADGNDELVGAHQTVSLSPDGFTVEGEPGGRERYVAIASRTLDGLGRFRDIRGACRFPTDDARKLGNGARIEGAFRATTGFTLLDDVRCKKVLPLPDKALAAQALSELPWCPALD